METSATPPRSRPVSNAARMRREFVRDLPATTLARLLLAVNSEYISPSIRMARTAAGGICR